MELTHSIQGLVFIGAFFIINLEKGMCLRWIQFHVPDWVNVGENAVLTCEYDLDSDTLYSVKWYREGREIYRFVPADKPPQGAFMMPGVTIDEKSSDDRHLVLKRVEFSTSGRFKCEVLTDTPYFKTLVKSGILQVVDLPKGIPILTGTRDEYEVGDQINITCTAMPSVPKATLTWYINDREARPAELAPRHHYYRPFNVNSDIQRPLSSSLRLEVIAQREHFRHGMITFLCKAEVKGFQKSKVLHTARETSTLRPSLLEGYSSGTIAQAVSLFTLLWLTEMNALCIRYLHGI